MKYFFVLGTNTALSLAELAAVIGIDKAKLSGSDFLLVDSSIEINPDRLIKRLGGTIKIGIVRDEITPSSEKGSLLRSVLKLAGDKKDASKDGKFNFGFSDYGPRVFDKKDLGIKTKKYFSEREISSRFVISREKTLSSVVVAQNKLLTRGIEIVLAECEGNIYVCETLAVQPFKDLSLRDYGRPARDDLSGMLPPKLAQIMINFAQIKNNSDLIIDPFCGSGTILSEAMILGYKNIFGSDLSIKAVEDTKKNISWVKEMYKLSDIKMKFLVKSASVLSKFVKAESVSAIVTEPYLGPQRGRIEFEAVVSNLEDLYSSALREFHQILVKGGRAVMIWPVFYGNKPITPHTAGFKVINFIPENFQENALVKNSTTGRDTIIYGRAGQKVFREIVVLEKI